MSTLHLAEDKRWRLVSDEQLPHYLEANPQPTDWGSDPMEILMAKQELERMELELELAMRH